MLTLINWGICTNLQAKSKRAVKQLCV